ncbi:unnamed protein product [Oikopleura dioica]|uniref:Uncharacterized protein n=1 Tax=Oikopleura dioica TaxID=34765 RepID=E4Y8F3_OIKDI|nr:unnamed protein product [Oikopleura dioica]
MKMKISWRRIRRWVACKSKHDDDQPENIVPMNSARARPICSDDVNQACRVLSSRLSMRKESMTPEERATSRLSKISVKSYSSMESVTLSRLDQYYEEQRESVIVKEELIELCDKVLDEYESNELPEMEEETERPSSVTTMQTLESEMTIPSPVETPREDQPEQQNKSIWQKVTSWPVLGLRRISPELFKSKTPAASPELAIISPTGSTQI